MKRKKLHSLICPLLCCLVLLCSACGYPPLPLLRDINPASSCYATTSVTWTTLDDLVASADCTVLANVISREEFYPDHSWRYQMQVVEDISGNLNTTGCDPDTFYVYSRSGSAYQEQQAYLLFLAAETVNGYPHMVYSDLIPALRINLTEETSSFTYNSMAAPWVASTEVLQSARAAASGKAPVDIQFTDTIDSYEAAVAAADEIWLIELDTLVGHINEYFDKYDFTILSVLTGQYDLSAPGSESYRRSLPVSCHPVLGQRYLFLLTRTETGTKPVSGQYGLLPASEVLFQQTLDRYGWEETQSE